MRRATLLRRFHGAMTVLWICMVPVTLFTDLKKSLPFLVALSVYALAGSHFASWQASRAETSGGVE